MDRLLNAHQDVTRFRFFTARPVIADGEAALWKAFRSGDREALNTIFDRYGAVLFNYGKNMTRDEALISDCIQDIFFELWVKRAVVAAEVQSIRYYLIKSLRRKIVRRLRAESRLPTQAIPENYCVEVEFNIEVSLIREQLSRARSLQLQASVAALSKRQQEAIYLKFYQNLSYEEIASIMETNVKSVYNLIARAVSSLRKSLPVNAICE